MTIFIKALPGLQPAWVVRWGEVFSERGPSF